MCVWALASGLISVYVAYAMRVLAKGPTKAEMALASACVLAGRGVRSAIYGAGGVKRGAIRRGEEAGER